MRLGGDLGVLTYCMNIHPAESWAECRAALVGPARQVKRNLSPDTPFAVGLRFSREAVTSLKHPASRADLKTILADNDFLPITVNGFPYGPFHGTRVKDDVYLPDWRAPERLTYTTDLCDLMADIAIGPEPVSLSTVPGAFKVNGRGHERRIAEAMIDAAAHCVDLEARTGVTVALAIEPEPCCMLETIAETVSFFSDHLYARAGRDRLAAATGLGKGAAEQALRRHLGLCYDVCHAAVEFEDPAGSIDALSSAGIPVHKLQLSAALRVARVDAPARQALAAFAEPTYLHQVVGRRGESFERYTDLPDALARGADADGEEWRIHFHVPVFVDRLEHFGTTQDFLAEILRLHRTRPISPHLEVETYTFTVLPEELRTGPMEQAVGRELEWVLEQLR